MIYRHQPRWFDAFQAALTQPRLPFPRFTTWTRRTLWLLRDVEDAARGFNLAAFFLTVEGRRVSLLRLLETVRFHAAREYPSLLANMTEFNFTALHALNLNDRFLVLRFSQTIPDDQPALRAALAALRDHLDAVPESG